MLCGGAPLAPLKAACGSARASVVQADTAVETVASASRRPLAPLGAQPSRVGVTPCNNDLHVKVGSLLPNH